MVTGIIGRKLGMTQVFAQDGTVTPATVIKAGPCVVVQAKSAGTDGYEAVQIGLANGGSVDGYVWDTLVKQQPRSTIGVRVAWRSPKYAFPPLVTRSTLPPTEHEALAQALFAMPKSDAGKQLLERLKVEGFERGELRIFDGIRELIRTSSRVAEGSKA